MPDEKVDVSPTSDPKLILQSKKMELDAEARKLTIEAEAKKLGLEVGWIGTVIGSAKNAPNNIAFLVLLLVMIAGFVVAFVYPQDRVEFWKTILPVLTLALGYVFGQKSGEK